jgi:hypothetical protein
VLIEPTLMELRFADDPLVPKMDLELAVAAVRVKIVFERKSDARRYGLSQGLWFEGQPGWHVDTTQGTARPIAESVTPAWLERLSRAPSISHPIDDLGRLLSDIIPRAALSLNVELPELSSIADLVDATPTFTLRAEGDLATVRATLKAVYGDVELDVAPAELPAAAGDPAGRGGAAAGHPPGHRRRARGRQHALRTGPRAARRSTSSGSRRTATRPSPSGPRASGRCPTPGTATSPTTSST